MTDPGPLGVGVRAALHALDAALAEHRRALALAASRRESERMSRGREVKAAAQVSRLALEQPVERAMRALRLAETWIEVDRTRRPLAPGVRAELVGGELRVHGEGWSGRVVIAPGEGPAAVAAEAVGRIDAAVPVAAAKARDRLGRVTSASAMHAAACHGMAAALAAADRDAAERHADRGTLDASVADLAERLGPRALVEPAELTAARDRLGQARAHLTSAPVQPYAWLEEWPAAVAGAMLRDLPEERLAPARAAIRPLVESIGGEEPLLALAAGKEALVAVTPARVLIVEEEVAQGHDPGTVEVSGGTLRVDGADAVTGLEELEPGRLAAVLELVTAAGPGTSAPATGPGPAGLDAVDLLHRLGELRDHGVLSTQEFDAKKAELLRRIR